MKNHLLKSLALALALVGIYSLNFFIGLKPNGTLIAAASQTPKDSGSENSGPRLNDAFFYSIGPRFGGIKRSQLQKSFQLSDFLDPDFTHQVQSYERIELRAIDQAGKYDDAVLISENGVLSAAQWDYLKNLDYGSNFTLKIDCYETQPQGDYVFNSFTPHLTVIPETMARYRDGNERLLEWIREQNYPNVAGLFREDLRPAKFYLSIDASGKLVDIELDKGCGYPQIDLKLIALLKEKANEWLPARNDEGEAVAQKLVFFFGLPGC